MIMILLVTAYNGIAKKGRQDGTTHGYSKYSRRPRVRTDFLLASLPILPVSPCWWTQHLEAARRTRRRKQQVIDCAIIE